MEEKIEIGLAYFLYDTDLTCVPDITCRYSQVSLIHAFTFSSVSNERREQLFRQVKERQQLSI